MLTTRPPRPLYVGIASVIGIVISVPVLQSWDRGFDLQILQPFELDLRSISHAKCSDQNADKDESEDHAIIVLSPRDQHVVFRPDVLDINWTIIIEPFF